MTGVLGVTGRLSSRPESLPWDWEAVVAGGGGSPGSALLVIRGLARAFVSYP